MTTIASVYKSVIVDAFSNSRLESLSIDKLYETATKIIAFDSDDLAQVTVDGHATKQIVWKRNLRNCLQTLKSNGTLLNNKKGVWALASKQPRHPKKNHTTIHDVTLTEAMNDDPQNVQLYARTVRKGAKRLREKLLNVYGKRCCISNTGPINVLQAAHIEEHRKKGLNHSTNALLLRSDLHDLFDDGLIKIEPQSLLIYIHPDLKDTVYFQYNGLILQPRNDGLLPSENNLKSKLKGLTW